MNPACKNDSMRAPSNPSLIHPLSIERPTQSSTSAALRQAQIAPHTAHPEAILALQRAYGNQAVQRMVQAHGPTAPHMIQRKGEGLTDLPGSPTVGTDPQYKLDVGFAARVKPGVLLRTLEGEITSIPAKIGSPDKFRNCTVYELHEYHAIPNRYIRDNDFVYVELQDLGKSFKGKVRRRHITLDSHTWVPSATTPGQNDKKELDRTNFDSATHSLKPQERGRAALFGPTGTPNVTHIRQGGLGNCYLHAALSSVLEGPDGANKIKALFPLHDMEQNKDYITVRFYRKNKDEQEPHAEFVEVLKSFVMNGNEAAYAKTNKALWPALVEKAYTKWPGRLDKVTRDEPPLYAETEGGLNSEALYHLVGIEGKIARDLALSLTPQFIGPGKRKARTRGVVAPWSDNPKLRSLTLEGVLSKPADRTRWQEYVVANPPSSLNYQLNNDLNIEAYIDVSALSDDGKRSLKAYCLLDAKKSGAYHFSDKQYTTKQLKLFRKIQSTLAKGGYVGLGSVDWGKGGGHSGGEDTTTVPGLAGGHAYAVHRAEPREGRYMLEYHNPWGDGKASTDLHGVTYGNDNKLMGAKSGTSWIDIRDIHKYFDQIYYNRAQ